MQRLWFVWIFVLLMSACSQSNQEITVAASSPAPAILFTDLQAGPLTSGPSNLGVPIAIFGKGFGATKGTSTVTIGGVEVARYMVWGQNNANNTQLDMIVVQPGSKVKGGAIVVKVNNRSSNTNHTFSVNTGKIYAIAKTGRDSNACSLTLPCATISHVASNVMLPGDTVLVRGGDYSEGEIWLRKSGLAGKALVIKNYPGEKVTLSNAARPFYLDADYITVSGFHFTNGKSLGITGWAKRNQIANRLINNTFKGVIAYDAIGSHGDSHFIAGNVCEVSGSTQGTQGHCYYISYGRNVSVIYNVASGAPGYGIHVFDQCRLLRAGGGCDTSKDFRRVISNLLIEGNIVKNSTRRSGLILAMNDEGKLGNYIDNVIIRNNIFTANNHAGIRLFSISRNIKIYHNTFYQNGVLGIAIEAANIPGIDIQNNLIFQSPNTHCRENCQWYTPSHIQSVALASAVNINNNSYHGVTTKIVGDSDAKAVTGTVRFVNPAALNFRILAGSSMIDKGITLMVVPRDFDGQARPRGAAYDTGAFEYLP